MRSFNRKREVFVILMACSLLFSAHRFYVTEADTSVFKAGFFTLGDIVIFSYEDNLEIKIYDSSDVLLTTQSMDAGDHYTYSPGSGVYYAIGDKPFSILIGDPVTKYVHGYFAANDSYYGVATEFYTYSSSDQDVITFAYKNGITEVNVEEWSGSSWTTLATFTLSGPGDYYRVPR